MNYRMKLSKKSSEALLDLKARTDLNPNILCRYAICMSLKHSTPPKHINDSSGIEILRPVLTGKYDLLIRELIKQYEKRYISDDDYFPTVIKNHIERGVELLDSEYKLAGNKSRFMKAYCNLNEGGTI